MQVLRVAAKRNTPVMFFVWLSTDYFQGFANENGHQTLLAVYAE